MAQRALMTEKTRNPNPWVPDEQKEDSPAWHLRYVDMHGQTWLCDWLGQGWVAKPVSETEEFYGLPDGNMFAGSSDAKGLIQLIEEKVELARQRSRDGAKDMWILFVLAAVVLTDKKG